MFCINRIVQAIEMFPDKNPRDLLRLYEQSGRDFGRLVDTVMQNNYDDE